MRIPRGASPELAGLIAPSAANDEATRAATRRVNLHLNAVREEYERPHGRLLQRLARGSWCVDVWISGSGAPLRRHVLDALGEHPRLLVVGGRAAGKSALSSFLAGTAARRPLAGAVRVPLLVPVARMEQGPLDEREIARLNPAAGVNGVRWIMEDGRAVVLVDGLDETESPDVLKESLAALAKRYPLPLFVVTTRPLPPKVAGKSETRIEGFAGVHIAAPEARPVVPIDTPGPGPRKARVQRVANEVTSLIARWQRASLLPDSGPCRFTERGALLLWSSFATYIHHGKRDIEISFDDLMDEIRLELQDPDVGWLLDGDVLFNKDEGRRAGVPVANPRELAAGIARQVCAYPDLFIERRPGIFAFAELAFQEYLTAIVLVQEDGLQDFMENRDPWWHDLYIYAVSLPRRHNASIPRPEKLLRTILDASAASDSVATFLAARCAEVARGLSESVRKEIARRLRAALPPRSSEQIMHLIDDVGDIAAPALIDALTNADVDERAFIATTLGKLDYPPTAGVLARLAADPEITTEPMLCWLWNVDAEVCGKPVGFFALAALFNLVLASPHLFAQLDQALGVVPPGALDPFVRLAEKKLAYDFYSNLIDGPSQERDPDRITLLIEKVVQAAKTRRAKQSPR